jgi:hypothetical protein
MRTVLFFALTLSLGCGNHVESQANPLTVDPIPGLPAYDGGRILHPWHFSKLDRDRFPARPIVASASDADCVLGDDRFDKCRIYDCEATPCPSGTCWDVALMYDPDGSPSPVPNWLGIPVVTLPSGLYYQPLHQATCLR